MSPETSVIETPEFNVKQADGTFARGAVALSVPEVQAGQTGPSEYPTSTPEPWINKSVDIMPAYNVRFLVGPRAKPPVPGAPFTRPPQPIDKTQPVRWHDSTVSVLERLSLPTDGSMVLLVPGTALPFSMYTNPWHELRPDATVYVVPNNPQQVGEAVQPTPGLPAVSAEPKYGVPVPVETA